MTGSPTSSAPASNQTSAAPAATSPSSEQQSGNPMGQTGPVEAAGGQQAPCCETGRPIVADPVTGQTVCSCQYDRLSASLQSGLGYSPALAAARLAAVSSAVTGVTGLHGVYSAAYPSSEQNPYPSLGMDSTFYSSLVSLPLSDSALRTPHCATRWIELFAQLLGVNCWP